MLSYSHTYQLAHIVYTNNILFLFLANPSSIHYSYFHFSPPSWSTPPTRLPIPVMYRPTLPEHSAYPTTSPLTTHLRTSHYIHSSISQPKYHSHYIIMGRGVCGRRVFGQEAFFNSNWFVLLLNCFLSIISEFKVLI